MKVMTLSDHTGDQLQARQTQRDARNAEVLLGHQKRRQEAQIARGDARKAVANAWSSGEYGQTLGALLRWVLLIARPLPRPPALEAASKDDAIWASGREGEQAVIQRLAARLSDQWTWLGGYRNRKGEIDGVLVGPGGVFGIEVKSISGIIYCDGDQWWRDKFDRYGNLVEFLVPITDKSGRGPSRQVNESADVLEAFLAKRTGNARVLRAVIFAHKNSRIGEVKRGTVNCIATLQTPDFPSFFESDGIVLGEPEIQAIILAVQKDHQFHARAPSAARSNHPPGFQARQVPPTPIASVLPPPMPTPRLVMADGRIEPEFKS